MQGLADGYFVVPVTIGDYLSKKFAEPKTNVNTPEFAQAEKGVQARIDRLFAINGTRTVDSFHKELGHIMWEYVGMARAPSPHFQIRNHGESALIGNNTTSNESKPTRPQGEFR